MDEQVCGRNAGELTALGKSVLGCSTLKGNDDERMLLLTRAQPPIYGMYT